MRDDICTIPVSEVFEPKTGCPVCRMRNMLEDRMIEYVLGASMMEPDVRVKTNEMGFCTRHLRSMMKQKNRLSLALMLETHLDYIGGELYRKTAPKAQKAAYKTARIEETCYVCDRIEWGMERLLATTMRQYVQSLEFRELFRAQEYICLPHYRMLMEQSAGGMDKKYAAKFSEDCTALASEHMKTLRENVHKFTKMFDYRSLEADEDFSDAKVSIENTFEWLTSFDPDKM